MVILTSVVLASIYVPGAFNHQLTGSLPSELIAAWSRMQGFNVAVSTW